MPEYRVFQSDVLAGILRQHGKTLETLAQIEQILSARFVNMDAAVEALILSVASGEPLLLVGPPGTAKSRLIREFCKLIDINPNANDDGGYFGYLLTQFTEPTELFGQFALRDGELHRMESGMMHRARVVFLDEVFNASSAILNSILTFMNERIFYDRGTPKHVEMECMFGATNFTPTTNDLRAVFDRFLLRVHVDNVQMKNPKPPTATLNTLMVRGWAETYGRFEQDDYEVAQKYGIRLPTGKPANERLEGAATLLDDLHRFQLEIKMQTSNGRLAPHQTSDFFEVMRGIVHSLRQYEYSDMSNRRLIKMLNVMLIHSLYEAVKTGKTGAVVMTERQLNLLRYAVDVWDDDLDSIFTSAGVVS